MNEKDLLHAELEDLRARIVTLEQNEIKLIEAEEELQATNQQLDASNQQLQASEQQLKAYNQQLQANEEQLSALNQQLKASEQELIQKEAIAQEAREYAENILATVREPLVILDSDLRVVTINRFFKESFQVSTNETEGQFLYNLGNKQWNIPSLKTLLKDILPKETVVENFEIEHTFEKIGKKIMLLNARKLHQGKNRKRLILLSIQDITERRHIEQNLKRLNSELERRTNELQQILYITTHDLRSPLVNIQGFNKELGTSLKELAELLDSPGIPNSVKEKLSYILKEEIPEAMHFITSSTNKMDALLTGLLALSRLGRQKLVFKNVDMNRLMQDVIDNFKYDSNKNNVILNFTDLPDCKGDDFQINQLFSNLVGNALKFLDPERHGVIDISGEKEKGYVKYVVKDNGVGIHPDHQEKVFELFHKLDPKKPGIGLGMNIVKQIVEKHMGKIELKSEVNFGTKVIIIIPD